jgi:hypothetical protein
MTIRRFYMAALTAVRAHAIGCRTRQPIGQFRSEFDAGSERRFLRLLLLYVDGVLSTRTLIVVA